MRLFQFPIFFFVLNFVIGVRKIIGRGVVSQWVNELSDPNTKEMAKRVGGSPPSRPGFGSECSRVRNN